MRNILLTNQHEKTKTVVLNDGTAVAIRKHRFSRRLKLTVNARGQVKVSMPYYGSYKQAQEFVLAHEIWIQRTLSKVPQESAKPSVSEMKILKQQAFDVIAPLAEQYAKLYQVHFARISIRDQSSVWGSCSRSGTLSFSWRLLKAPEGILKYVVVHEVCHRREMNHSKRFWDLVALSVPEYKQCRKWLRTEGKKLHFS